MAKNPHLVVTVHGIRTYGQWQSRLKNLLEQAEPGITVRNAKYGYFSILAFIFPFTRWLVTRRFRRELLNVIQSQSWSRIDLVGHSFGTHLLAWALHGVAREKRPRIHTIILAGSVLKSTFPWDQFLGDSVKRLVNECGTRDGILLLNQIGVLNTGMAGRIGFHGMTGDTFQNRYYQFGHSDYFLKGGKLDDDFMRQFWLPLLTTQGPILEVDNREYPKGVQGVLSGIQLWALNNAEPIKLVIYLTPPVLAFLYVLGLYNTAEKQRQLALARQLAAQSELLRTQEPRLLERSTLLAIEAIRRLHSVETDRALRADLEILPRQKAFLKLSAPTTMITLSHGQNLLATAGTDKIVHILKFPSGHEVVAIEHPAQVSTLRFSPDDHLLATGTDTGGVKLWELPSGKKRWSLDLKGRIDVLEFSPKSPDLLIAGPDVGAAVWNLGPNPVQKLTISRQVVAATYRGDGRFVATADLKDQNIRIWDVQKGTMSLELPQTDVPTHLAFSSDGRYLAVACGLLNEKKSNAVWLWDVQDVRLVARIPQEAQIRALSFSPNGTMFVTVGVDGFARIWHTATGEAVRSVTHGAPYGIKSIAWSASSKQLATAGTDGTARVWDVASGNEIALMPHGDIVNAVTFEDHPDYVVTASGGGLFPAWLDHSVRIWQMPLSTEHTRLLHQKGVNAVAFSPNGRMIATGSDDGLVRLFSVPTGNELATFEHGSAVNAVAFDPHGKWLASASDRRIFPTRHENLVWLWDVSSRKELLRIPHADIVRSVAVSPDGHYLATGGGGGIGPKTKDTSIHLWTLPDGQPTASIAASTNVESIAFSPDGKLAASVERRGILIIWRPDSGAVVARLDLGIQAQQVVFDQSGRRLAIAALDSARIYDVRTLRELQRIPHDNFVNTVAFATDAHNIATGDSGKSAHIWDLNTNREIARFRHDAGVSEVTFSPDGRLLVTAGFDKIVHLWLWRAKDLIAEACSRVTRDLTELEWHQYLPEDPQRTSCGAQSSGE
ncbi:MAG: hypothetical protein ACM3NN_16740 [Nitrospirota bacterium]